MKRDQGCRVAVKPASFCLYEKFLDRKR